MSTESVNEVLASAATPTGSAVADALIGADLFSLGRRASAARDERLGRRGSFVRARQLLASGEWKGPRDAAEAFVEEADLPALGGVEAARAAGVTTLVGGRDWANARGAAEAGLQVLWRVAFRDGEPEPERLARLTEIARTAPPLWGLLPAPAGEPYGLDTLRFFALSRLVSPTVPHLVADVTSLGPRLAQMAFGFGADELFAPIVAERALRIGDNAANPALTRKEAATLIRGAGLTPCERMADGAFEEVTP